MCLLFTLQIQKRFFLFYFFSLKYMMVHRVSISYIFLISNVLLFVFFILQHKEKSGHGKKSSLRKANFHEDFKSKWKQFFLDYAFVWQNVLFGQLSAQNSYKNRNEICLNIICLQMSKNFL